MAIVRTLRAPQTAAGLALAQRAAGPWDNGPYAAEHEARCSADRTADALRQRERALKRLHEIAVAAGGVLDLHALGRLVVDSARDLLGADSAGLYWWDEARQQLGRIGENDPVHTPVDVVPPLGKSVARLAYDEQEVTVVEDYASWCKADPAAVGRGLKSAVAVPLRLHRRAVGTLVVRSYTPRRFEQDQIDLLQLLAAQVAPALDGARLHAESERRRREAEALAELAQRGASIANVEQLADLICERACQLLQASFATLIVDAGTGRMVRAGVYGNQHPRWAGPGCSMGRGPAARCMAESRAVVFRKGDVTSDGSLDGLEIPAAEGAATILAVPIKHATKMLGSLIVGWREDVSLGLEPRNLAEAISSYAAVILENSRAHAALAERAETLASSQERLRTLYESLACGILVWDDSLRILHANGAAQEIIGRAQADLLGHRADEFWTLVAESGAELRGKHSTGFLQAIGEPVRKATVRINAPLGSVRWLQVDVVPVPQPQGRPREIVASFIDVTARKEAEEELHWQALHDSLTGLPNRSLINDRLQREILRARREGHSLALMFIDLDRFKDVNDTFGHAYGDSLLQQIGPRLQKALRSVDMVGRLGGDEFAVILPGLSSGRAPAIAHKLGVTLAKPVVVKRKAIDIRASIGVATFPEHAGDAQSLMRVADVAMYAAKRAGSGHAVYNAAQDPNLTGGFRLTSELRHAIEHHTLELHYQPQVNCGLKAGERVEALVRWPHPDRGLLAPDEFVPLAEQTGLIKPLTRCVLEIAARQCREWHAAGSDVQVAVNVSIHSLQDSTFPRFVQDLIDRWGLSADWLRLEVTESTLMANAPESVIRRLTAMGIRLSIDDFGTGYSSLVRLKQLPIDEIKIDKSFVIGMASDANDRVIVGSIIELAHNLGKRVVAEGVETAEAWRWLVSAGCDAAQGYYLGHPMPAAIQR
jgi:diguanylate cyclase (GGDEF)-like protein/PAS domain S-box-containing protein